VRRILATVLASTALFAFSVTTRNAAAQIVNVQPLVQDEGKQGPSGNFDGSFNAQSGNTEVFSITGQLAARYRYGRNLAFVLASATYGTAEHVVNTNKDLEHLRWRFEWKEPLEVELFAQHERDEFRRLGLRLLTGAGPRLHLSKWKPMDLAIGTDYMIEYDQLQEDALPQAGAHEVDQRWSSYFSVAYSFGDPMKIGYTFYVQPRFDKFADYRILSDLAFVSTMTKHWSVKF
jgi:hypothetical protein